MGEIEIKDPVVGPFAWQGILRYLGSRLIPDKEMIEDSTYKRKTSKGWISVSYLPDESTLAIRLPLGLDTDQSIDRIRFLLQHRISWKTPQTLARDPVLGPLMKKTKGMRPIGCWDKFELCMRTIVGQQVTVAAARTITKRISDRCGGLLPDAIVAEDLDAIGMPRRRVATLKTLAQKVATGEIDLEAPWEKVRAALKNISGIGPWTVGYLGIRMGRDPDAFPASDVGLIRTAGAKNMRDLEKMAEAWRPHRSLAATYLWANDEV